MAAPFFAFFPGRAVIWLYLKKSGIFSWDIIVILNLIGGTNMITVLENNLCGKPMVMNHSISFVSLANAIKQIANQYDIALHLEEDTIKVGSGFFKTAEHCLVVYNAHHLRDYNCYALVKRPQEISALSPCIWLEEVRITQEK